MAAVPVALLATIRNSPPHAGSAGRSVAVTAASRRRCAARERLALYLDKDGAGIVSDAYPARPSSPASRCTNGRKPTS